LFVNPIDIVAIHLAF